MSGKGICRLADRRLHPPHSGQPNLGHISLASVEGQSLGLRRDDRSPMSGYVRTIACAWLCVSSAADALAQRMAAAALPHAPRVAEHNDHQSGRIQRAHCSSDFEQVKGLLPLPVKGRITTRYGAKMPYGGTSKGIVISTHHGAMIVSPADGWVKHAGRFRTYGNLLTIGLSCGYQILIAGAGKLTVKVGQFVLAAEPVGSMPVGTPNDGDSKVHTPILYVEFRKDGQAIDPSPWWSKDEINVPPNLGK